MEGYIHLIESINQEIYEIVADYDPGIQIFIEENPPLEFSSTGYAHAISFFGIPIWCSENDERPMLHENTPHEDYIPLSVWIKQEVKRILSTMSKFDKCLEGKLI